MIVVNQFQSLIKTIQPMIENVMFFDDWDITYFPMFRYVEKLMIRNTDILMIVINI